MKGDFSRNTFDPRKHYRSVLMQQGRVQLDADWNEQGAIGTYRTETGMFDVVGGCGGPVRRAGFRLVNSADELTVDELKLPQNAPLSPKPALGDLLISGGRYYVEGTLVENDRLVPLSKQPDLPPIPNAPALDKSGLYIAYLDVWERHLTALDDPSIREVALGGPDTATRVKTVWQVKFWFAGTADGIKGGCRDSFPDFDAAIAPGTGRMSARTKAAGPNTDPCIVPPGAGYRGLENQLYRVEVHAPGNAIDPGAGTPVTVNAMTINDAGLTQLTLATKVTWAKGDALELFPSASGSDPMAGTLAFLDSIDGTGKILVIGGSTGGLTIADAPKVRPVGASYKWSRDNGSVVTTIEKIDGDEITVRDLGPDATLGFAPEQWVELSDDLLELHGLPGQLAQIRSIDPASRIITLRAPVSGLAGNPNGVDPARHPKLRRWDGVGAIKAGAGVPADAASDLEDGVQIRFTAGSYRTGDYWTIPARTATSEQNGNIEWPKNPGTEVPSEISPAGIRHRYCRIAMVKWEATAKKGEIEDCRCLFSPLTRLTTFQYVGGDGQEARPGFAMPQPLQVGLFNAGMLNNCAPVAGSQIRFTTLAGGRLAATSAGLPGASNTLTLSTDAAGIASVAWQMEPNIANRSQTVEARLLSPEGVPLPQVIFFHGNLSIAGEVAYDPKNCRNLQGVTTVEQALDEICRRLGESGNCHPFLDELRSDGVVRSRKEGKLGLGVRALPPDTSGGGAAIEYEPGIAYVRGCRHEIEEPGKIDLGATTSIQWIVVDRGGQVEARIDALPPRGFALLALVSVRLGVVERIVDMRRDLTHLDEQLERTRHDVAASRKDAREYVPLLAEAIPDLEFRDADDVERYRDGRNHAFNTESTVTSIVFDGRSVWIPQFQKQQLMRIDRYASSMAGAETIQLDVTPLAGTFDGTSVWYTAPNVQGGGGGGTIVGVDVATLEVRKLEIPGIPMNIMFDGEHLWVTTSDTMNLVQIDVAMNQIIRIVSLGNTAGAGPIRPLALECDPEYLWVSGTTRTLFRLKKPFGAPEAVQVVNAATEVPSDFVQLAFDGSHLWLLQLDGNLLKLDVLSRQSKVVQLVRRATSVRSMTFDGSYMWLVQDDSEAGRELHKVDARIGVILGSIEFPHPPLTVPAFPIRLNMFDGTHFWYPYRPGGTDDNNKSNGLQKLLIT